MHDDRRGHRTVPVAAPLALLATALLAACGTTPTAPPGPTTAPPSVPATAAPTIPPATTPATLPPTAPPASTTSGAAACTASDLKASHGLVEGAAGSRLTEVVLVAGVTCSVDLFPTLGLRDANGAALVGGVAGGAGRLDLSPEVSYTSSVRVANWCVTDPAFPVVLGIRLGAEELAVTGSSFPEEGDLPPCNGEGGPILEAGAWTPGS